MVDTHRAALQDIYELKPQLEKNRLNNQGQPKLAIKEILVTLKVRVSTLWLVIHKT